LRATALTLGHTKPMLPIVSKIGSVDLLRLRDRVVTAPCFDGVPGDYPWDRWEIAALEAGVSKSLASLGRSVFREAFQHDWASELKVECGWLDGGAEMILYAIAVPGEIEERWRELIDTDGVPNDHEVPCVDIEPAELSQLLTERGIRTSFIAL
jgi:hypothetical protein